MPTEKIKCPQCRKLFSENEIESCDNCEKDFCLECLTYFEELAFCEKCRN